MGELIPVQPNAWNHLKTLALDSVRSPESRRSYSTSLDNWRNWYEQQPDPRQPFFSKACVQAYRSHLEKSGLAPSSINVRLSAIRKLTTEAADNGLVDQDLATGIARVKGTPKRGERIGNWLGRDQAQRMVHGPDPETLAGKQDRAILAVLVGCGLRRGELVSIRVDQIQQRDGRWVIVDVEGKGGRIRSVPMAPGVKAMIDAWVNAGGITDGFLFRPVNKGGKVRAGPMEPINIYTRVRKYARFVEVLNLAPHDLRRTFAKLAYSGKSRIEQIQMSLGHSSIMTTERYLGSKQDFSDAPSDHLGISFQPDAKIES